MPNTSDCVDDDQHLVRRCLQGDVQSQSELVERYAGLCVSIARRMLGSEGAAFVDDAVQETLYSVFAKLHQWHGRTLAAWIGAVAARRALDVRKRLTRWRRDNPTPNVDVMVQADLQDDAQSMSDMVAAVEQLSGTFSKRQKRVLEGMLDGYTRQEIAGRLKISERTVYQDVAAIRRGMSGILESFAGKADSDRH